MGPCSPYLSNKYATNHKEDDYIYMVSQIDRKSTRLNSSHLVISYAVFCLKKKKNKQMNRLNKLTASKRPEHEFIWHHRGTYARPFRSAPSNIAYAELFTTASLSECTSAHP